jgi:hypothetical protein
MEGLRKLAMFSAFAVFLLWYFGFDTAFTLLFGGLVGYGMGKLSAEMKGTKPVNLS